jgi:hypothetical protein
MLLGPTEKLRYSGEHFDEVGLEPEVPATASPAVPLVAPLVPSSPQAQENAAVHAPMSIRLLIFPGQIIATKLT